MHHQSDLQTNAELKRRLRTDHRVDDKRKPGLFGRRTYYLIEGRRVLAAGDEGSVRLRHLVGRDGVR